jgi:hypothetical protein
MNAYDAEKELNFLAETDEEYAGLITAVKAHLFLIKKKYADAYIKAPGKNAKARESVAEIDSGVLAAKKKYLDVHQEAEIMSAKRETARLRWEHWRSLEATRRHGL